MAIKHYSGNEVHLSLKELFGILKIQAHTRQKKTIPVYLASQLPIVAYILLILAEHI
jgi:hypothetical protein